MRSSNCALATLINLFEVALWLLADSQQAQPTVPQHCLLCGLSSPLLGWQYLVADTAENISQRRPCTGCHSLMCAHRESSRAVQVGTFDNMTSLVEEAVEKNDGRKAMLVAHSMGSLVSLYFLDHKNADWL